MKAVQIRRYGGLDALEITDAPEPAPGPGECLVRVRAAGVNPIDWKIREGMFRLVRKVAFPWTPGMDVSGEVVRGGARFAEGDEVFAMLDYSAGAYAEYVAVPEAFLAKKPASLDHVQAAAVPLAGLTALQALRDKGRLAAAGHVLIIGGSGGVGHLAVQIAKAMGARVTAVCGTSNVAMVRDLGADRVIDYRSEDFRAVDERYDVILDAVGTHSYGACARLLAPRGVYVSTLPSAGIFARMLLLPLHSRRRARMIVVKPGGEDLAYLARLADEGMLRAIVEKAYPLAEAARAHEASEGGHVRGKLVLTP